MNRQGASTCTMNEENNDEVIDDPNDYGILYKYSK